MTGVATPRKCERCGIEWRDTKYKFTAAAPCRDCRDVLALEGFNRQEWLRPHLRRTAEVAA